jgi:hypothetical protein
MPAKTTAARGLRVLLAVVGLFVAYTGVDNAFGGIASLGFQSGTDFFTITDAQAFAVRDSNVRFLGGLWIGVGLLFAAGAVWFGALKPAVCAAFALVFVGGLARFTAMNTAPLFGGALTGSLVAELALMPALLLWVLRTKA